MCLSKWIFMLCFGYTLSTTISGNISESTDDQISKSVNTTRNDENIVLDYFYGNQSDTNEETQDNLDFSMMDIDTVKKLFENARNGSFMNETGSVKNIERGRKPSDEANRDDPYFLTKTLDLMKQSIYATRYRLQETRTLRKQYSSDPCYNLAIYYGSLMQLRIKLDNVYNTLMKLGYHVKFLWFLKLYERCLAINVDVTFMVERMFKIKGLLMSVIP